MSKSEVEGELTPDQVVVKVSARQRVLAALAILAGCALIVCSLLLLTRHWHHLVAATLGIAIATAGGWWTIARRGWRRVIGVVLVFVGAGLSIAAMVEAWSDPDNLALSVGILSVLLIVTFGSARLALRHDRRALVAAEPTVAAPAHPVLICNPWSGGGKVEKFGLVELAEGLGIETILLDHGLDLEQLARDAISRGADCLGMAGGDGSQALVASIAVEHDIPFVCVSAGTRNHFALDLGIDREDPRKSIYAFRDAVTRRIDYATVNGRFFVNNVSLGVYATIVQRDEYRDAKVETTNALLPELLGEAEHPFDLQFTDSNGTDVDGAYLIQVSNNPYVLGATIDVAQRRRMDSGTLGVFAVTGTGGLDAATIATLSTIGQRKLSPNWHEFTGEKFEVRSRSGTAFAGVDGEALEMKTPITFEIHPRGLHLLVPTGNSLIADRRRARQVTIRDLFNVVRGIDPLALSTTPRNLT
jgi:diacylglycerol kinase family enzyme